MLYSTTPFTACSMNGIPIAINEPKISAPSPPFTHERTNERTKEHESVGVSVSTRHNSKREHNIDTWYVSHVTPLVYWLR